MSLSSGLAPAFILTRFDRAGNFMMQLVVGDLDAWWAHIKFNDLVRLAGASLCRVAGI
jgi:hypothetical protein